MKTRKELMKYLAKRFENVRTTEEFYGSANGLEGGIWVSGESDAIYRGKEIYNYYAQGKSYTFGVLNGFEEMLNSYGWYSQWYNSGTIHIYEI